MRTNVRSIFLLKFFICHMRNINIKICRILSGWIIQSKSNREFALNHNIDEKMVRRILDDKEYRLPIETLNKICEARGIKLSQFFKLVEEENSQH